MGDFTAFWRPNPKKRLAFLKTLALRGSVCLSVEKMTPFANTFDMFFLFSCQFPRSPLGTPGTMTPLLATIYDGKKTACIL